MRFFIAFFIALTVYLLLLLLYFKNFSNIKIPSPQKSEHVIKISLKELMPPSHPPKQGEVVKQTVSSQKQSSTTIKSSKKKIPKKTMLKRVEKKLKPSTKKIIRKKIIKKKIIKKKVKEAIVETPIQIPIEPFIMEEPIVEEIIHEELPIEEEEFETEVPPLSEAMLVEESNTINTSPTPSQFEQEMVYIAEPMLKTKKFQQHNNELSSFLASPSNSTTNSNYPSSKIQQLYGVNFQGMTSTQKAFIEENLDSIQAITQRMLSQRGYPEGAGQTGQEGTNVVVFNLHPNGDISDLRLKTYIGYRALDENTLSLIRVAYKDYPYPSTTTQIIFYVTYTINGY